MVIGINTKIELLWPNQQYGKLTAGRGEQESLVTCVVTLVISQQGLMH